MENVNQESLELHHLPDDIFHFYIFKYLDLCDIFKLKLISKKFNCLVNSYNIKELSILNKKRDLICYVNNFRKNWFSTIKSINLRNLIITKCNLLTSNNLRNLQYLSINGLTGEYFELSVINKFKKLQILLLDYSCKRFNDHSLQLQLPDLEALSIRIWQYNKLILDTPKLKNLNLMYPHEDYSRIIEFRHPESVKYLRILNYEEIILKFINLECLELDLKEHYSFSPDDLLKFIKLKKFKFNSKYRVHILDDLLRVVKGSDIELVINGVKIEKNDEIEEFKSCSRLQFQLQNYSKLEYDLDLDNKINYNDLIYHLPNHRLPSDLFKKYNNIQWLKIKEVPKEKDLLIYVIKECHNLYYLFMNTCSNGSQGVGQEFYDQLPLISNLYRLIIIDTNLNYDFINKMTYLSRLEVGENIFKNEIYLNDLKFLDEIIFSCPKDLVWIYKNGKDKYRYKFTQIKEFSLSELIKRINDHFK